MDKTISQLIYDLYEIKENPLENINRLYSVLDKAASFGVEIPPPSFLEEDRVAARLIENRSDTLQSLYNCVSKYLSSERQGIEGSEVHIRQLAEEMRSNLEQNLQYYDQMLKSLSFKITDSNRKYFENLISQLIGRRLEHELLPNLMEKMGYKRCPTAFKIEGKIVEIDGRYEHSLYDGATNEILVEKNVIIVECKTTIGSRDVEKFSSKVKVLKGKYENDKANWGYDNLKFESWIIGCYGWSEKVIREAEERDIRAFTPEKLEEMLKKYKAFDGRISTCPPCE